MKLSPKYTFPIWQVTFPLCIVLLFAVGAATTIFLVQGRYLFDFEATPNKVRITTDIDKRDVLLPEFENINED